MSEKLPEGSLASGSLYRLNCKGCGTSYARGGYRLYCDQCGNKALLATEYAGPLQDHGDDASMSSYSAWLPFVNSFGDRDLRMATISAPALGAAIGARSLWVAISGYSSKYGTTFRTGTFKECEAIGVLNRVRDETEKVLIISSAGNAGRAFLEYGLLHDEPAIVIMPESAAPLMRESRAGQQAPLLILLRDAYYPDAIKFVDRAVQAFAASLIREGGCFNVARRDAMAVPFLRAVRAIGGLPDRYVQAVGSGTGAIATWEAAERLLRFGQVAERSMRLLLVQNAPFAPMVDAWRAGAREVTPMDSEDVHQRLSQTIASVLSNASPPYAIAGGVYDVLRASGGTMCAVSNDAIRAAQALTLEHLGFEACTASAAALAGLVEALASGEVGRDETVLLHLTGGGFDEIRNQFSPTVYQNTVTLSAGDDAGAFAAIEAYLARVQALRAPAGRLP